MEQQTSTTPEVPARQVLKLVLGYQISGVVTVIARLNLADHLVAGPRPASELAEVTGAHPDALLRLMRVGASLGLFEQVGSNSFALNELSDCLRSDRHSVRGVALTAGKAAHTRPVELLYEAVMDGRSVVKDALGMEIWEYWDSNPEAKAAVTEHLVEVNAAIAPAIRDHYDLSRFKRIVDVGGNEGFFLAHLLELAPQATGVLFDRPEVMDDARRTMASMGLTDRVEFVGGDFRERIPPGGDLYVLKGILHDSSNEAAARVLDSCYVAAPPGSTLMVVEGVINGDPPLDPIVQLIDINMLIMVNGRERSLPEFDELFEASGWKRVNTVPLPSAGYWPFFVLECRRT